MSWGKRQDGAEPEPTDEPLPEDDEDPFPEDPEDDDDFPIVPPGQGPTDTIGLEPPTATVIWGKRNPQQFDTIGLQFPTASFYFPSAKPPTYISWGKRQDGSDEPEPTAFPEDPEDDFPEDPVITQAPQPSDQIGLEPPTATVIWGKEKKREAVPQPQDSIGLGFPWQTVYFPKPGGPPTYVSWGKREAEGVAEATGVPERK